ncbi:MAG: hypothetical protein FWD92_01490 [Methanomassiliicoccaceae archaeon]|nr:hypothetical protein [Methanomassiliicoccaceae archaeon]
MKVMLRYAEISNMTMEKLMEDIIERIEDELDASLETRHTKDIRKIPKKHPIRTS